MDFAKPGALNIIWADINQPVAEAINLTAVTLRKSGVELEKALAKNRYIGRTFIQPQQYMRERGVKIKLNALRRNVEGKRVIQSKENNCNGSCAATSPITFSPKTFGDKTSIQFFFCITCLLYQSLCMIEMQCTQVILAN